MKENQQKDFTYISHQISDNVKRRVNNPRIADILAILYVDNDDVSIIQIEHEDYISHTKTGSTGIVVFKGEISVLCGEGDPYINWLLGLRVIVIKQSENPTWEHPIQIAVFEEEE